MDWLITAAARALVQGDPLGATLVLRPLNTRPDGSGSRVLSFQIFDILVAILLSQTIAVKRRLGAAHRNGAMRGPTALGVCDSAASARTMIHRWACVSGRRLRSGT